MLTKRQTKYALFASAAAVGASLLAVAHSRSRKWLIGKGQYVVGQSASLILSVQQNLAQLGYDVPFNSILDARTKQAVERFQSLYDLDIDGMINQATVAALQAAVRALRGSRGQGQGMR